MTTGRTADDLKTFLSWTADKGLVPAATVHARKAASNMVLDILSDEEAQDVTALDLDDVMRRFQNLKGKNYTPTSLRTYQSRLGKAVEDFKVYLDNPMAFKPSGSRQSGGVSRAASKGKSKAAVAESPRPVAPSSHSPASLEMPSTHILSIPIRADLVVRIQGLPFDLSVAEAEKIANVVKAMAMT